MPARRQRPRFQLLNNRHLAGESPYSKPGFSSIAGLQIYLIMTKLSHIISNRLKIRTDKLIETWVEAFDVNKI